jgi:hypothetical protein
VYTSEDSVRYSFFSALLQEAYARPEEIVLDYPLLDPQGTLEMYIGPSPNRPVMMADFRYSRPVPARDDRPRLLFAAQVLGDLARLAGIGLRSADRLLVLLLTRETITYLKHPSRGLCCLCWLHTGEECVLGRDGISPSQTALRRAVPRAFPGLNAEMLVAADLPRDHQIRVVRATPVG